ncbi:3-oxoadipate enol-lactonase [Abyssibacter profundi]|uniref:3-oxoadipate enol-lactonase n=2 Tax=Abyssibacter profundi TaxID=2182787 RepID=A0A363UP05_9GAMM|nr:3-oxoadipate enol-lactonase [Abyssibacter profundi]
MLALASACKPTMPTLRLEGTDCHYNDTGEGPALVLIHGLGASQADWFTQLPAFERQYRCIAPDLTGHGGSSPDGPYDIFAQARRLFALLDALGVQQAHVLGHSMGGAVAQSMALVAPERVRSLTICNSTAGFRPTTPKKLLEAVSRVALVGTLGVQPLAGLIAYRLFPHADQADLRRTMRAHFAQGSRPVYLCSLFALGRWSIWHRLADITCSTLVIAAEHDYFPLTETQRLVEGIPDAQLQVFPGSRHGTPMDRAEAFNTRVLEFLAAARGPVQAPPLGEAAPA